MSAVRGGSADTGADPGTEAGTGTDTGTGTEAGVTRLVAVTSCPTGIAHTYMAAEALEQAAAEAGVGIHVETQGSVGADPIPGHVIAEAAVIFAADVEVRDKERFAGKPTVQVGVKSAISDGPALISRAVAAAREAASTGAPTADAPRTDAPTAPAPESEGPGESRGAQLRGWLMTGVSYMIPFVAAGGILIALGFALGGYEIDKAAAVTKHFDWTELNSWAALCFQTGQLAFEYLVPVLSGYIAFAMADRPGSRPASWAARSRWPSRRASWAAWRPA